MNKDIFFLNKRGSAYSHCNLIYHGWLIAMKCPPVTKEKQWRNEWGWGSKRGGGGTKKRGRRENFGWNIKNKTTKHNINVL